MDKDTDCAQANLVYKIKCKTCIDPQVMTDGDAPGVASTKSTQKALYIGQTGRSAHSRFIEHVQGINSQTASCPLYRHVVDAHGGIQDDAKFQGSIVKITRTNLTRMLTEAAEIQAHTGQLFNNKSEYRGTKIIRMVPHREVI